MPDLKQNMPGFAIDGFAEACVSVRDIEQKAAHWAQVFGWVADPVCPVGGELLALWNLPKAVRARQIVLRNPAINTGFMRLIEYANCPEQTYCRPNDCSWDTGGIFDLNMRTKDLRLLAGELMRHDWQGTSDPVDFEFGPMRVIEWICKGPGQVFFALSQRLAPPLEGEYHLNPVGCLFNSTQIVRDMDAAVFFYRDLLGFAQLLEVNGPSGKAEPNVFGLPPNLYAKTDKSLYIFTPQPGLRQGTVELLSYPDFDGRDLSQQARPPNLGINSLRFPVAGLDALYDRLRDNGLTVAGPVESVIEPWGKVRIIGVNTPENACLEFFERLG